MLYSINYPCGSYVPQGWIKLLLKLLKLFDAKCPEIFTEQISVVANKIDKQLYAF